MLDQKWYNEDDLRIYYYYNDEPKDVKTKNYLDKIVFDSATYKLVYLISGDRIFEFGKTRIKAHNGMLAIVPPNAKMGFERTSNKTNCYMQIDIHPKVFDSVVGDSEFLRVFHNSDANGKVFDVFKLSSQVVFDLLDSLYQALDKHLGRIHILPKVLSIISELDLVFDEQDKSTFKGADNYSVNLMRYIELNFTKKLTLEEVCNKYFITKTTVNNIVKKNTGKTFLKYVDYLRIKEAEKMVKNSGTPLTRIYKLVGFDDYSTFYRQYKSFCGVSPSKVPRPKYK